MVSGWAIGFFSVWRYKRLAGVFVAFLLRGGSHFHRAQLGAFDAQSDRLRKGALHGCALAVNGFESHVIPVKLVANACAGDGGHDQLAAAGGPLGVLDETDFAGWSRIEQRAAIPTTLVLNEGSPVGEDAEAGHGETSGTQWQAIGIKQAMPLLHLAQGNSSKTIVWG